MLKILFAIITAFGPHTDELARGAQHTAPSYLTPEHAYEHAFAAVIAGEIHDVRPELLLSIAWHESRFSPSATTPEIGHKVSCGVMTPEPKQRCSSWDLSLVGGYVEGAAHLATWNRVCSGNMRCTLTAYAGGGAALALCKHDRSHRACTFAEQMLGRSAWILRNVGPSV